jgi:hypothetical protein
MSKFRVQVAIHASNSFVVEAETAEEAKEKASELEGCSVPICHQCNRAIDEPTYGQVQDDVYEESDDKPETLSGAI